MTHLRALELSESRHVWVCWNSGCYSVLKVRRKDRVLTFAVLHLESKTGGLQI
ncbi:hypothetical protein CCACVL1_15612 [Corchorus capsularis]|uniref:Uncharacterized protein n=1 Tax=Corchorus capsularis TaxID=210143 RepID=A0A1R3I1R4_COCAP|nr:hypothetical protein CCACVL1_15612 [Corchorus capsularis]